MYRKCQYLHFCSELSRLQVCFQANFTFKWKVHVPGSQLTLTSEHSGTRVKTREALAERQMYGWKNIKAAHNPPSACVCACVRRGHQQHETRIKNPGLHFKYTKTGKCPWICTKSCFHASETHKSGSLVSMYDSAFLKASG